MKRILLLLALSLAPAWAQEQDVTKKENYPAKVCGR